MYAKFVCWVKIWVCRSGLAETTAMQADKSMHNCGFKLTAETGSCYREDFSDAASVTSALPPAIYSFRPLIKAHFGEFALSPCGLPRNPRASL